MLMNASQHGRVGDVRLLLNHGADANANAVNSFGTSALKWAALGSHLDVMRLFLHRGADVNTMDCEGRSVLLCAVEA